MAKVIVAAATAATVMAGCGGGDRSASSPDTTAPAPVAQIGSVVLEPFLESGGTLEQGKSLLTAGCLAIALADPTGDSGSLGSYFTDLLDGGSTGSEPFRRDRQEILSALQSACGQHRDDPESFIDAVADSLDLSADDLTAAIHTACSSFEERRRANLDDSHAPEPFDAQVMTVLAVIGIDRSRVETLLEAYCPT